MMKKVTAFLLLTGLSLLLAQSNSLPRFEVVKTVSEPLTMEKPASIDAEGKYILTSEKDEVDYQKPVIYNIQTNETVSPFRYSEILQLRPQLTATGSERRYEISKMKLAGKYAYWDKKIVYVSADAQQIGLYLSKKSDEKVREPVCECGGTPRLVEQYSRYLCDNCKKYVDEDQYIETVKTQYFAMVDVKTKKITWAVELGKTEKGMNSIGVDPSGKHWYYYENIWLGSKEKSTDGVLPVRRLNLESRKIDWAYDAKIPKRTVSGYAIYPFVSPDFSKIAFWEYDEPEDRTKPNLGGSLENPTTQVYVIDVNSKSHFALPGAVVTYGHSFDHDGKNILIGSNAYGDVYHYSLETKSLVKQFKVRSGIYHISFTPNSKYVLVHTKVGIYPYTWPDLKATSMIPLKKIFPYTVESFLTSENPYITLDGGTMVMPVMEKSEHGPWWSPKDDSGFHIFRITDE